MKHSVLIVISLFSSILFNSKHLEKINDWIKKELELENLHSSFMTFILYGIIIYLIGLLIDHIGNYKNNKELKALRSENKELRRHLTQHSIKFLTIKEYDIESINDFRDYMMNFADNHPAYLNIDLSEVFKNQSDSKKEIKINNKININTDVNIK